VKILSVVIVTYNKIPLIETCLDSIYAFNDIGDGLEIIVSDNSPDDRVVIFLESRYQDVKVIHNKKNGGFGYGNNRGADIATGEYLLFLNPDTILIEPIFQFAVQKFQQDKTLAEFGLKLITPDGTPNHSHMILDGHGLMDYYRQKYLWKKDIFIPGIMFTSGADLFIRKEVFVQIGKFDEHIFMYYEEADILRRIQMLRPFLRNEYFPDKKIIHLEGGIRGKGYDSNISAEKRELDSLMYYCNKYGLDFKRIIEKKLLQRKIQLLKYFVLGKKEEYRYGMDSYFLRKSYINKYSRRR